MLPRLPRLIGVAFASAALPYAWMVWLSHQAPFISFYGPLETWSEFWFFFSRQGYGEVDVSPSAGWSDRWSFAGWLAADLVRQTTLPGSLLALAGLAALARGGGLATAAAAGSGVVALLGNSLVLIVLLGFDFDPFRVAVFRAYPLICYGIAALWVGAGLQWLMERLPDWAAVPWPALARRTTAAATVAGAAMVVAAGFAGWPANDRSSSDFAERHADALFELLPQGAVLFAFGDTTAPLGYYRYVEGRRPDTALYNLQGLVFDNRLSDPLTPREEKQRALGRFVDATDRPVFVEPGDDIRPEIYPEDRGVGHYGFLLGVLDEGTATTFEAGAASGRRAVFPRAAGPATRRPLGAGAAQRASVPVREVAGVGPRAGLAGRRPTRRLGVGGASSPRWPPWRGRASGAESRATRVPVPRRRRLGTVVEFLLDEPVESASRLGVNAETDSWTVRTT